MAARPAALLAGALCLAPAHAQAGADAAPDLLFNCQLAGVKRVYLVSPARGTLFDQGIEHPALLRDASVSAEWLQPWSADTRMHHRLHIGRLDGTLTYQVDELDASGTAVSRVVAESGTCSREKIHPRHFR